MFSLAALSCVAFAVLHIAADRALPRIDYAAMVHKDRAQQVSLAQSCVTLLTAPLQGVLYFMAALSSGGNTEDRLFSSSPTHTLGMQINLGVTLYETGLYLTYGKPAEFWAHHLLGIFVLTTGTVSGHFHQTFAWAGVAEITGLNLALLDLMKTFGLSGTAFVVNGVRAARNPNHSRSTEQIRACLPWADSSAIPFAAGASLAGFPDNPRHLDGHLLELPCERLARHACSRTMDLALPRAQRGRVACAHLHLGTREPSPASQAHAVASVTRCDRCWLTLLCAFAMAVDLLVHENSPWLDQGGARLWLGWRGRKEE